MIEKEENVSKDLLEFSKQMGQKYFPDEYNIWARPNHEARYVREACIEAAKWQKDRIVKWLQEYADGYTWCNELEGESGMTSDFIDDLIAST